MIILDSNIKFIEIISLYLIYNPEKHIDAFYINHFFFQRENLLQTGREYASAMLASIHGQ